MERIKLHKINLNSSCWSFDNNPYDNLKLLEPTEIGKMFCLLGLSKALMKMIGKPLFSLLYKVPFQSNCFTRGSTPNK